MGLIKPWEDWLASGMLLVKDFTGVCRTIEVK
jgi:hypothetical protein